ncbi:MAG TPA: glycosyltransferase, partial [Pseudonocardiaceae bacterium]
MVGSGHAARSTVIVVTWRGRDHLAACLDALAAQSRPHATIVVDNGSTDGTADILAGRSEPTLRLRHNRGFAGGVAVALREVRTPFVAWLNDDAAPARDWLGALEDALDRESGAAAVGSPLVGPDGAVQSLGVRLTEQ